VDHPDDPGGITNWGVSLRWLQEEGVDINLDGVIDSQDIIDMEQHHAEDLFYERFWKPMQLDQVEDQEVATKWFDMAVNMGPAQATKLVQRAVGVDDDGKVGPVTLSAVNCAGNCLRGMQEQQLKFYEHLIDIKPRLQVFQRGWTRRAAWPDSPEELGWIRTSG
jgi:lysozyme family protein